MNERELLDLEMAAYQRAWTAISQDKEMTPDERESAPRLLRAKILRLINEGQRDAADIALEATGDFRQKEQIMRSTYRVQSETMRKAG